jgi:stage II sporulation protein D
VTDPNRVLESRTAPPICNLRIRSLLLFLLAACLTAAGCIRYPKREAHMYNPRTNFLADSTSENLGEPLPKIVVKQFDAEPILRIGFMEGYEKIDFRISGEFDVNDLDGDPVFTGVNSRLKWRSLVEGGHGATFIYSVLVTACREESEAIEMVEKLRRLYPQVRMQRLGGQLVISGEMVNDNTKYRILAGAFETETEAKKLLAKFSDEFAPRIIREKAKEPRGRIEVYDAEYDYSTKLEDGFRIVPRSPETTITLYGVKVGSGFQWESMSDRTYRGIVEIRLGNDARLTAISEIPLDQYLRGVVPAEMPAGYPAEALMAQAVAARSAVLAKLGTKHLNDAYDFCANVHCQVYSGIVSEAENTNLAVAMTGGEVIYYEDNICDAVYSAVCGGHTEHKRNVWNPPDEAYLQGIYYAIPGDSNQFNLDLTKEKDVRAWIDQRPDVYCSLNRENLPTLLAYSKKYFRWEVSYSRKELEDIIKKRTDEDIGILYDIIPLTRGVSGRLMEIEVLGSRKNIRIKKELNIRRALSPTYLRSACFVIDIEMGEMGTPLAFHFRGAGWGHGVGLCQIGAAVMALDDFSYRNILEHYYKDIEVKSVYAAVKPKIKERPKEPIKAKIKEPLRELPKEKVKEELKAPVLESHKNKPLERSKEVFQEKPTVKPKESLKVAAAEPMKEKPKPKQIEPLKVSPKSLPPERPKPKSKPKTAEKPKSKLKVKPAEKPKSKPKAKPSEKSKVKTKAKPILTPRAVKKVKPPEKTKIKGKTKPTAVKKIASRSKPALKPKVGLKAKPALKAKLTLRVKTTQKPKARPKIKPVARTKISQKATHLEKSRSKPRPMIASKSMGKLKPRLLAKKTRR